MAKENQVKSKKKQYEGVKASINFDGRDVQNADFINDRLHCRTQTITVSRSLEITRSILEMIEQEGRFLIEDASGNTREVKFFL